MTYGSANTSKEGDFESGKLSGGEKVSLDKNSLSVLLKLKYSPRNKSSARHRQQEGERPKVNKISFA